MVTGPAGHKEVVGLPRGNLEGKRSQSTGTLPKGRFQYDRS